MTSSTQISFNTWSPEQLVTHLLSKDEFATLNEQERTELRKVFVQNHVNGSAVPLLKAENLTEMGIHQVGLRVLIVKYFEELTGKKAGNQKLIPVISRGRLEPEPWSAAIQKTEKERVHAGLMYFGMESALVQDRERAKMIIREYNQTSWTPEDIQKGTRQKLLKDLFGEKNLGSNCYIEPPFYIDYGTNTTLGDGVYMNYNCVILDVCQVKIGKAVFFAPNVQLYPASHPLNAKLRISGEEYGSPLTIGDGTWIGGGAIVMGGVTIGENCVIGAGSVVTRDIPPNSVAVGNPARVVATISQDL